MRTIARWLRPSLQTLEDRLAPGSVLGDVLSATIPAQFGAVTADAPPPSTSLTLVNLPPQTAPAPAIDPGVTLFTQPGYAGTTITAVASALTQPAKAPIDTRVNDALFAPPAPPPAPMPAVPAPAPPGVGSSGGGSPSLVTVPPAPGTPPPAPVVPPPPPVVPPPSPPVAPTAMGDGYLVVGHGTFSVTAGAGVLANDLNPSGLPMTASLATPPLHGSISLGSDGSFAYAPQATFTGTDYFFYRANAGGLSSIPMMVVLVVSDAPPNGGGTATAPTANADAYTVVAGVLSVPPSGVLGNDTNPTGQPMTASVVSSPANGVVMLDPTGSFEYDANPGFVGTDTFTYTATAGGLTSNVATVTLNVTGVAPPAAADDAYTVDGGTLTVLPSGVQANDTNPTGQPMTASLVTSAGNGSVMLGSDGSFTYTANPGYVGTDSFTYTETAGGLTSNVATVSLTVIPATAPTAIDDAHTASGGYASVPASGVMGNDINPGSGTMSALLVTPAGHGTLAASPDGSFTYTANPGYVGTDSFTYRVTTAGLTSNVATVTLTVTAPTPPTAIDDGYAIPPNGGTLTVSPSDGLLANDISPDGLPLTAVMDASPTNGTVTLNSDGSFGYTANPGTSGNDRFTYHVTTGALQSGIATVTLTAGSATVGGLVWLDANADGDQSAGETGIPAVTVNLFDAGNSLAATTTTDSTGHYSFTGVASGASYYVQVVPPAGEVPTAEHVGPPNLDSDVDADGASDTFYVGAATNTTLDAGEKPAAVAAGPEIEFVLGGKILTSLYVAKWEKAFEKKGVKADVTVKQNFIVLDTDRFRVLVIDAAANTKPKVQETITVHVNTTSDTGNDITLLEDGVNSGKFYSDYLLLTSVQADDKYKVDGVTDNTLDDRTFLVKLNDAVKASYTSKAAITVEAKANVPIYSVVKLHLIILRTKNLADGGQPVTNLAQVGSYVDMARQIYAQVGIYLDPKIDEKDPPAAKVNVADFATYTGFDAKGKLKMTADETNLLGDATLRTAAKDAVEVYFVGSINNPNTPKGSITAGIAYITSVVPDAKYADSIVMNGVNITQTLAHELGHILMDSGVHPEGKNAAGVTQLAIVNLMAYPFQWHEPTEVADSRRITAAQQKAMLTKRPNVVSSP